MKDCGIYRIYCKVGSKIHGVYVGQSTDLMKRKRFHFKKLDLNKHPNSHLQRLYTKYGKSSFYHEVLEYCEISKLTEREQYWFDKHQETHTMCNQGQFVDSPNRGMRMKESSRKKMSESRKGIQFSPETRKKMSESRKGIQFSPETRKKMSEAKKGKGQDRSVVIKRTKSLRKTIETRSPVVPPDEVKIIRQLHQQGIPANQIKEQYPYAQKTIRKIIRGELPYDS